MNRSLWAACAAILLAGTLTACSTTPANDTNSNGNNSGTGSSMNSTNGTNGSGTTGSANGNNNSGNNHSNNSGSTDVTNGTNNSGNTNGTGGNGSGSTGSVNGGNSSGGMNSTGGTPSGTSNVTTRRTQYPAGADQDRASYNRMTSSRSASRSEERPDSRYTAYSDGYVYPGSHAMSSDNGTGLAHDVARTARGMVTGVGDMFRDAGNAVRNVTGGINDTRQATAGQTNANQRMSNNARNTMLNANAE